MGFWDGFGGAAIGALANIGGGLFSAAGQAEANAQSQRNAQMMFDQSQAFNLGQAEEARRLQNEQFYNNLSFQSGQAERQMQWQEGMANTAYQRAMADMRKAGLNPILAYQQGGAPAHGGAAGGGGGGSPTSASVSGAGATAHNTQGELGRALGNAVSSAVDTYKTAQGVELMKAQEKLTGEQERRVGYETGKLDADTQRTWHEIEGVKIQNEIKRSQAKSAAALARVDQGMADNMDRYGKREAPDTIERILRTIQGDAESRGGLIQVQPKEW